MSTRASPDGVLFEGHRTFSNGKSLGRIVLEFYGYLVTAGLVVGFLNSDLVVGLVIGVGGATVLSAIAALNSRGRIQLTHDELRVRSWRGTRVIPSSAVAQVVHVRRLEVMGGIKGYVAVLAAQGEALWRSPDNYWEPATIKALGRIVGKAKVLASLTPQEAGETWPGLLPWTLSRPNLALALAGVGTLLVCGLVGVGIAALAG